LAAEPDAGGEVLVKLVRSYVERHVIPLG
jgi:hypothetical protein